MFAAGSSPTPRGASASGVLARTRQWLERARGRDSDERQRLELVGKSALVATVSWFVAHDLLRAQSPAFAPFSAVLIMQITAYQALLQALRCVGAVAVGVALQGVLGTLLGSGLVSFALVALIALGLGRWSRLGSQGFQVVTAAFFAFSTYAMASGPAEGVRQLGQIVLLVLVGCGVGVVVNVLVLPPVRYRSAEYAIHTLGHSLCDLACDMGADLRAGALDKERTEHWRRRARRLDPLAQQARAAVETAWESTHYNPLRWARGRRTAFGGYRRLTNALQRIGRQLESVTRSLDQWDLGTRAGSGAGTGAGTETGAETGTGSGSGTGAGTGSGTAGEAGASEETGTAAHRRFLERYGEFLAVFSDTARIFSVLDESRLREQVQQLDGAGDSLRNAREALAAPDGDAPHVPVDDPSQPFGILLAEAERLLAEVRYARDVLEQAVGR